MTTSLRSIGPTCRLCDAVALSDKSIASLRVAFASAEVRGPVGVYDVAGFDQFGHPKTDRIERRQNDEALEREFLAAIGCPRCLNWAAIFGTIPG